MSSPYSSISAARQYLSSGSLNVTPVDRSETNVPFSPCCVSTPVDPQDSSVWSIESVPRSKSLTPASQSTKISLLHNNSSELFPSMIRVKMTHLSNDTTQSNAKDTSRIRSLSMDSPIRGSEFVPVAVRSPAELEISHSIPRGFVQEKLKAFGSDSPRFTPKISDVFVNGSQSLSHTNTTSPIDSPRKESSESMIKRDHYFIDASPPQLTKSQTQTTAAQTQTEVLFAPTGQSTLLDRGNYKANTQILIAELDAAKDLNKKLSLQFAKAEKDLERLKIEHKLQKDRMDATLATKLADAVEDLHQHHPQHKIEHKTFTDKQCQTMNITTNSHDPLSDVSLTSAALLEASSGSDLSPSDIQANCELMLTYIREKGCQVQQPDATNNNNNDNKNDQMKQLQYSLENLNKEKEIWTQKSASLSQNVFDLERDLLKEREITQDLQTRIEALESERQNLQDQCQQLDKELESKRSLWSTQRTDFEHRLHKANEELQLASASIANTDTASKDVKELEQEKRELNHQLEREQTEKQELFVQLNAVIGQLAELEQKAENSDSLKEEKERISSELRNLYSNCQELQDKGIEVQQSLAQVQSERDLLKQTADRLQTDLDSKSEHLAELQAKLLQNAELQKRCETLEKDLSDSKKERDSADKNRNFLQAEIASLRRKVDELVTDRSELDSDKQRLEGELGQLAEQQRELEEARKEREVLVSKEEELSNLKGECEVLDADNAALRHDKAQLERELSDLKAQQQDQDRIGELTAENDRIGSELDRVTMKLEQKEAGWEHELYEMRQKYREADDEKFTLKEQLIGLRREYDALRRDLELREESREEQTALADENRGLRAQIAELRHQLDSPMAAADSKPLSEENKKLKAELDKQQRLVIVLRRKLTAQSAMGK